MDLLSLRNVPPCDMHWPLRCCLTRLDLIRTVAPHLRDFWVTTDLVWSGFSVSCKCVWPTWNREYEMLPGPSAPCVTHVDIDAQNGVQYLRVYDDFWTAGCYIWRFFKIRRGCKTNRRFLWQFNATMFEECRYVVKRRTRLKEHVLFTREHLLQMMFRRRRQKTIAVAQLLYRNNVARPLYTVIWSYLDHPHPFPL